MMSNFSVLMPLYAADEPGALRDALVSVIEHQVLKPSQVVLVIDGPISEALSAVVHEWADRLRVVQIPNNIGLSNALNLGLAECIYDLVFRMDSDDIALPERFKRQVEFFDNNPDVAMCSAQVRQFSADMAVCSGERVVPCLADEVRAYARLRTPVNHMALGFRKKAVLHAGGYPDTRLPFEDWWLCLRVLKVGGVICNVPDFLVNVRAGDSFYGRRGGYIYAKKELEALGLLYGEGLMSAWVYVSNVIIRVPMRLLPPGGLKFFYEKVLRRFF